MSTRFQNNFILKTSPIGYSTSINWKVTIMPTLPHICGKEESSKPNTT